MSTICFSILISELITSNLIITYLLGEEAARDEVLWLAGAVENLWQLADAHVEGEVPGLPEGVLVGGWEWGVGDGRAVEGLHDALGEQEVAEEAGDEQVLAEELLEEVAVEHVPGDGVRDGGEDPVELAHHGAPVGDLAGYALEHVEGEAGHKLAQVLLGHVP